jgi:hypothetical protein
MSSADPHVSHHPAPQRQVLPRQSFFAVFGGPLAWFLQLNADFALASNPCFINNERCARCPRTKCSSDHEEIGHAPWGHRRPRRATPLASAANMRPRTMGQWVMPSRRTTLDALLRRLTEINAQR